MPDNVHRRAGGRLLTAGMKDAEPACGGRPGPQEGFEHFSSCPRGGRMMFGAGPGALPSDALMGIPVAKQRDRMDEVLCIVKLLRGNTVTHKSDWFELNNAHLQMTPFMRPSIARRAGSSARCTLPTLANRPAPTSRSV
jgi:hypothetical protein